MLVLTHSFKSYYLNYLVPVLRKAWNPKELHMDRQLSVWVRDTMLPTKPNWRLFLFRQWVIHKEHLTNSVKKLKSRYSNL